MVSQTLAFQGNAAYYRADTKTAQALYQQALQAANLSKEPEKSFWRRSIWQKLRSRKGRRSRRSQHCDHFCSKPRVWD